MVKVKDRNHPPSIYQLKQGKYQGGNVFLNETQLALLGALDLTYRKLNTQISTIQKDHLALDQILICVFSATFTVSSVAPRISSFSAAQKTEHLGALVIRRRDSIRPLTLF